MRRLDVIPDSIRTSWLKLFNYLKTSINIAKQSGIPEENIIVDPGNWVGKHGSRI